MDEDEIINIIDPEGYKGYRYLPINSDGKICMDSPYVKAAVDGMGIWFFDHLLSTNIINLIRNMNGFESCTYDSPDGDLMSETGIISTWISAIFIWIIAYHPPFIHLAMRY